MATRPQTPSKRSLNYEEHNQAAFPKLSKITRRPLDRIWLRLMSESL